MTREEIAIQLSILVEKNGTHNEKECGNLLKKKEAASILLHGNQNLEFISSELRTASGDLDLLVCCKEYHSSGEERRKLIVWELKAPQLYLFTVENTVRASPTSDLYSAENQLLHYHAQLKENQVEKTKFSIISPEDVELGGIIIGRTDKYVQPKKNLSSHEAKGLATIAHNVRENNFYEKRLKLWTWDQVIFSLNNITANNQLHKSVENMQISAKDNFSVSVTDGTSVILNKQL